MRYMHIFHQEVVIANHCIFFQLVATVDSYEFADCVVVPNTQAGRFPFELKVLGVSTQNGIRGYLVAIAKSGVPIDDYIGNQVIVIAQNYISTYVAICAYNAVFAYYSTSSIIARGDIKLICLSP